MLRRIEQWLVVVLLVIVIGANWAVLQSAAWAGMFVTYSRGATIQEAWTKTFDGKHPCKLCHFVKNGRATEKKQDLLKIEIKLEFTLTEGTAPVLPPKPFQHFTSEAELGDTRNDAPLLPPPRVA